MSLFVSSLSDGFFYIEKGQCRSFNLHIKFLQNLQRFGN